MKIIRIGIVGLGRLGFNHAINIKYATNYANLTAVCSINTEKLEKAKNKLMNSHCFPSFKAGINETELDAVVIASPSDQHCGHDIFALKKGLHVFCEKPLGILQEECFNIEKVLRKCSNQVFMLWVDVMPIRNMHNTMMAAIYLP
jgi:myo-inositol 2-dehydrogenase/D-chiro-inositol 1-dehydrogenase